MISNLSDTFCEPLDVKKQPIARYVLFHEDNYYMVDGWQMKSNDIVEFYVGRNEVVIAIPVRSKWYVVKSEWLEMSTVGERLEQGQKDLADLQSKGMVTVLGLLGQQGGGGEDRVKVSKDVLRKTRAN